MLAESVEFLNNFRKQGASGDGQSVYKCRKFLGRLVENFLSDTSKISLSLRKDGNNSEYFAPLQFCGIFLRDKSEVFLPPPPNQSPATPPLKKSDAATVIDEDSLTQSFLWWFLSRILVLLGHEKCVALHERTLDTVHQILQAIKWRDAYFYGQVLREILLCVADLVKISDDMFQDKVEQVLMQRFPSQMDIVLKSVQEPSERNKECDMVLSAAVFNVDDIDYCELLQLNFTKLLHTVGGDVSKFCLQSQVNALWTGMCYQLECGDVPLKTESLRLLSVLLHKCDVPGEVEDYFIDCITALLQLLCTGLKKVEGLETKEHVELEKAAASVYLGLVTHSNINPISSHHATLQTIMFKMAAILHALGMGELRTREMKEAICSVICMIQRELSPEYRLSMTCESQRNMLMTALINEIGVTNDLQFLVGPLVRAIMCDMTVNQSERKVGQIEKRKSETGISKPSDEAQVSGNKLSRKRKHEESTVPILKIQTASKTYKLLKCKLDAFLQQDTQGRQCAHIEGMQVILEIVSTCIQIYSNSNKSATSSSRDYSQLAAWLGKEQINLICGRMFTALQQFSIGEEDKQGVNKCFTDILRSIGALLAVQDSTEFDADTYQTFGWIASLPWLLNDPSWVDLKPANIRDIVKMSTTLVPFLGVSSCCECMRVLALLPKEVAHKWRVHVFRQALIDGAEELKQAALLAFPLLLYNLGPNANHLVYDLIHPCVSDKELHKALVKIAGPLACVVSRKAVLNKSKESSQRYQMYKKITIGCLSCDATTLRDVSGSPKERPKLVDPNMFLPFIQLVESEKPGIKHFLIESIRRVFGHIGVRKNNTVTINMLNTALTLIEDPEYDTRVAFSEVIQYLLGDSCKDTMEEADGTSKLVLAKLREALQKASIDNHARLQETVLLTIAQLGRISEGELLVVVIIVLLEGMLSPTPLVAAVAYEQLKDIAEHKNTKTQNLFVRCRHNVCKFLVEAMHDAQTGKLARTAEDVLFEACKVFGYQNLKDFLNGTEKYILPYLVSKGTPAASTLIKLMATKLDCASRSKLLIVNTKYVFSYLVRFKPKEADLQAAIQYLQKETNFEICDLLRLDFQRVHNELLLHIGTNYTQVFHGLKILSSYETTNQTGAITNSEQMAAYLKPRILGVLTHIDTQLVNSTVPMEEKRPTLESLISIIRLMGCKIISSIRHKVMSTLRSGLQYSDKAYTEISVRAWNCFVRSLELPFLGQMSPQIVATLLPLLKRMPKQAAEIFNYIIVDNRNQLKSYFHNIYFLPDLPELDEANKVLKVYQDSHSNQADFKSQLEHALQGIQHEFLDVRLHALSKLKKLLKEEKIAFSELVMESETANPTVSTLISVLLNGCREADVQAQRLYAECLGNCGAIDPSRLELSHNNKADMANFMDSVQRDKFAVALINEVLKCYLAATEPREQDCSAFALQELLSIYNISESSGNEPSLWNKFSDNVKEILIPLLSSKYILAVNNNWTNLRKPIYCSKKVNNEKDNPFKIWVSTWTGYLSSKVKTESKAYKVFRSCSALIKFDLHIALYILPHVVLHVLQDGSSADVDELFAEINEVLNQVIKVEGKQAALANLHHMSAQTVFSLLDYLTKWKYRSVQFKVNDPKSKGAVPPVDTGNKAVCDFLARIDQDKLARVSFTCKAYTRALMHYELYLKGRQQLSKEELDFMQRLYVELDEPDGVQGVAAMRQAPPSLHEQILTYSGRLGCQVELQACYDQAIQSEPDSLKHHQGLLRCWMDLSQPTQAIHHATGVIAKHKVWAPQLLPYQVEAAWKLGNWDDIQHFVKVDKTSRSWSVMLGRILLAAKAKKEDEFLHQLQIARQEQLGPLSAASMEMGSYQRGYEHIVRLHILNEIQETVHVFMNLSGDENSPGQPGITRQELISHWQTRLKMMQSSFRIQESVLTMRRTLMNLMQQECELDFDREIGHSWLCSAKTAQKTGYLQTASRFLLQASEFNMPEYCLQKAKWHWEKDEHEHALSLLKQQMDLHFSNITQLKADNSEAGVAKRKVYAKALLLYGRYSEETSKIESNAIVKQYREVTDIAPDWEHGYFYLGKYFDRIMTALVDDKDDMSKQGEFMVHVVKNLGMSLRHGSTFIYQSLPRLLSLWLDFGTAVVEQEKKDRNRTNSSLQKNRNNLTKLNSCIGTFGKTLAPYQLFFSFSQLRSRICHAHPDVFQQLKSIIARLVVSFPQQSLWLLMAVSKSSYQMRVKRCQEIFATAREMNPDLQKCITDHIKLTERLLELCEKDLPLGKTVTMSQHFKPLKRLLEDSSFSRILLPRQSSMTVQLPNRVDKTKPHEPFPSNLVYISGFDDNVEILPSLQKPKKITMKGSDGGNYVMMCKPKDDLRKDCRLMEFNGIVNKFLRKDPESRKRSLYIRTYTVIPLNEECGLLEWVNNTCGLRHLLIKLYKEKGIYTSGADLKAIMPALQSPKETKLKIYKEQLLPRHPPVFGEWFLRTFPDPTSWYNARLVYCKTVAVMSMVGYILGLGDRHGENILFDSTTGDCVHVDFNCLFNRGETFEWPEKVPFRLTHNLIHAMGPLKLEGIYRRACEVTLRVMRKESEPLMSVLKPFVYDPLVEWSKPSRGQRQQQATETAEITNEQGRVHVQNIEQRLQGILNKGTKRSGLALSVEGHVNHLIQEATNELNLCQMYVGWAAYM